MIRYFVLSMSVAILIGASPPSDAAAAKAAAPAAVTANPATPTIPSEISIASSVGAVTFRHQMHITDLGIKCGDCHHQINAKSLKTPHPDYLGSSWINCKTCHDEAAKVAKRAYVCSECHQSRPKNIADETLSAKVVIHKQCWKCHSAGTGKEATSSCEKCHSGKKKS